MVGLFPSHSEDIMLNMRCISQILMLLCTYQPLGVMAGPSGLLGSTISE